MKLLLNCSFSCNEGGTLAGDAGEASSWSSGEPTAAGPFSSLRSRKCWSSPGSAETRQFTAWQMTRLDGRRNQALSRAQPFSRKKLASCKPRRCGTPPWPLGRRPPFGSVEATPSQWTDGRRRTFIKMQAPLTEPTHLFSPLFATLKRANPGRSFPWRCH